MKERPILFSGAMVRAILDGHKTQTRRVIKLNGSEEVIDGMLWRPDMYGDWYPIMDYCPYRNHMHLWVREAWRTVQSMDKMSGQQMADACLDAGYRKPWAPIRYEADGRYRDWDMEERHAVGRLRPSIHMPRWASRITLEITGVRVERLQEISREDMEAEGIASYQFARGCLCDDWHPQKAFADLWDNINEKRGYGWNTNPFVWVISFKKLDA